MHYRDRPTERPVHTFERVSPMRYALLGASAWLALSGVALASKNAVGHDVYCTRDAGAAQCVLRERFAARTVERAVPIERAAPEEMARALRAQLRSNVPFVFDGRLYRDSIDASARRGEWARGWSAYEAAAAAFFDGRDSHALFVRQRFEGVQLVVGASISLALLGLVLSVASTINRRRFRVRFDPNTGNAWVSSGTLFALGPEREVRLGASGLLDARTDNGREQLVADGAVVLESLHSEDGALFRSLARGIELARGPIKTIATPLPTVLYASGGAITAAFCAAMAYVIVGHSASLPSTTGTIELRAETECHYDSVTLLAGGTMSWVTDIGPHEILLRDARHRTFSARTHVAPGTTTLIRCTASAFEPPPANL